MDKFLKYLKQINKTIDGFEDTMNHIESGKATEKSIAKKMKRDKKNEAKLKKTEPYALNIPSLTNEEIKEIEEKYNL